MVLSATLFSLEERAILVTSIELNDGVKLSKTTIFQPEDSGKTLLLSLALTPLESNHFLGDVQLQRGTLF